MSDWVTSELHLAAYDCDLEYVVERISAGDDVNLKDAKGFAPLHWRALRGLVGDYQPEIAEKLLEAGADPNSLNEPGTSVLEWALRSGNIRLVEVLLRKGADVNLVSSIGTPLMIAAGEGRRDLVDLLLSYAADASKSVDGFTAADHARNFGHDDLLPLLTESALTPTPSPHRRLIRPYLEVCRWDPGC